MHTCTPSVSKTKSITLIFTLRLNLIDVIGTQKIASDAIFFFTPSSPEEHFLGDVYLNINVFCLYSAKNTRTYDVDFKQRLTTQQPCEGLSSGP